MAALASPGSPPATSPPAVVSSQASNPNHPALPPIITTPPARRSALPRPMSHASKNRLSQYSVGEVPSRSRPPSHVFPPFASSLSYTLVRDFAYPAAHPMHYGPPPEPSGPPSGMTTPASESQRRLSDPPTAWDSKPGWANSWGAEQGLPAIQFSDGPPWSEDEDLQSPVVSSRHRKHKSSAAAYLQGRHRGARDHHGVVDPDKFDSERGYYVGTSGDGGERYYVDQGAEANGPGGEYVTYPPGHARHTKTSSSSSSSYQAAQQQQHQQQRRPRRYTDQEGEYPSDSDGSGSPSSSGFREVDESRYSRDYQFTITSPDEEMHGKAVALFDFERENENELPLVEGQIIWVSYRHGQGWLVAEDPKTQESGLVPEEYVRLLRDIEGGMNSLAGHLAMADLSPASPNEMGTPTQADHSFGGGHAHSSSTASNANNTSSPGNATGTTTTSNGYHQPILSTFSTSSKDLDPYPQHLLGTQAGQAPPQVVHYHGQRGGSQANTPTIGTYQDSGTAGGGGGVRRGSQDTVTRKTMTMELGHTPLETLPDARMESPTGADEKEAVGGGGDGSKKKESR